MQRLSSRQKLSKKVKKEIIRSAKWEVGDIRNDSNSANYVLVLKEQNEKIVSSRNASVCINSVHDGTSVSTITCPCRKLECERIPCSHLFAVLHHMRLERIPDFCVMRRWTTKEKYAFPSDRYGRVNNWSD